MSYHDGEADFRAKTVPVLRRIATTHTAFDMASWFYSPNRFPELFERKCLMQLHTNTNRQGV